MAKTGEWRWTWSCRLGIRKCNGMSVARRVYFCQESMKLVKDSAIGMSAALRKISLEMILLAN